MAQQSICIVGGGASGLGLAWAFAKAKQRNMLGEVPRITIVHDQPQLGGHSYSVPVTVNGVTYDIDLGVQMIAPSVYPAVLSMLALPEFQDVKLQDVPLDISCAFPPASGQTPYWGNFPGYQTTPLWQQGKADCATFQTVIATAPGNDTLQQALQANAAKFQNLQNFENYFLDPYMSIMNGYGGALLDEVTVMEIAPLFDLGYAKFTAPGTGFQRFAGGSGQWIEAMYAFAQSVLGPSNVNVLFNATVDQIWPSSPQPTVQWSIGQTPAKPQSFDVVVLTTDMWNCSRALDNASNKLWSFYAPFVGTNDGDDNSVWPLVPGYCYLHQDPSILAPNMPSPPQETLQFTAYWATQQQPYDLVYSFTTYVERNLMSVADPDFDYYLTMYGFDPTKVPGVPIPTKGVVQPTPMNWKHGMWLPFFMEAQKKAFHMAQSASPYVKPYPKQPKTGIFFAGNNLTMDSEEGALASALVLADYAFGLSYAGLLLPPLIGPWKPYTLAMAELEYLYRLMFPAQDAPRRDTLSVLHRLVEP